jgi:hypothetical protein
MSDREPEDRFAAIQDALGRLDSHAHDPVASTEAAASAAKLFRRAERDVLSALVDHPCTAFELDLVFPNWRRGYAAKRASSLKRFGLVDTGHERRQFPGRSRPTHVYTPTRYGKLCAAPWPRRQNGPVADIVARGLIRLEHEADPDAGRWPCPHCAIRCTTRQGVILHGQRAHGIPRLDPHTLRPINESDAA